jgi:hypothetical protein
MAVKITSVSSATSDNGLVCGGLLPRDNFQTADLSAGAVVVNTVTENGFPFNLGSGITTATKGFNEFLNFDQVESFALRKGITGFWRPLDPLDYVFKNAGVINVSYLGGNAGEDIQQAGNPIVIGLVGLTTSTSQLLIETVLHGEYTQGPFTSSVVNLGTGKMTTSFVQTAADIVFGAATNTAVEGISRSFAQAVGGAIGSVGSAAGRVAGNIANRLANYYSSTDAQGGTALIPSGRGRRYNMMEVD